MTVIVVSDPIELAQRNCKERIDVFVRDETTEPPTAVNATTVELTITDNGDNIKYVDEFPVFTLTGTVTVSAGGIEVIGVSTKFIRELAEGGTVTIAAEVRVVDEITSDTRFTLTLAHTAGAAGVSMTKATRIDNSVTGQYFIDYGDSAAAENLPDQTETNQRGTRLFTWKVNTAGEEQLSTLQVVRVVTGRELSLIPYLRTIIDKSVKSFDTDPDNPCFLGYTDSQLLQYLEEGLSIINAYEPYPVFNTLVEFPHETFLHILIESALVAGVMSQQLFAIDEDVPNFSDQGNTFVIQHAPQLAAFLTQVTARLDKLIPQMKLKFVNTGSLHIQAGANFRLAQLLQASPNGALFRNVFFRGT